MQSALLDTLRDTQRSVSLFIPETILTAGALLILLLSILVKKERTIIFHITSLIIFAGVFLITLLQWETYNSPTSLFGGMLHTDGFSCYLKLLFNVAGFLTVVISNRGDKQKHIAEYYVMIIGIVLGAHILVMSISFIMVFLSLELISLCSYVLAGFSFTKQGGEGSLKYFMFGSVASATMLYGLSIFYGLTGTMDFSSHEFIQHLATIDSDLLLTAGIMVLTGFLYKIAAAPLHPWAPDVYEAAPMPVIAFFSVVPKLAGVSVLAKFLLALNRYGNSPIDWQLIISIVAILTLTVGNFSALKQTNPKRMMAYSSIAQSGFLLVGVTAFTTQGMHFTLFYASVYVVANFLVFILLDYFESKNIFSVSDYAGVGKALVLPAILLFVGLVTLTGLPPTSGFTGKLFIFSSLWESYSLTGKPILLWLFIFGLLNTVVSLFYYLRIPYYAFLKAESNRVQENNLKPTNLLGVILVVVILILFFFPGLLMGWINKINFVL